MMCEANGMLARRCIAARIRDENSPAPVRTEGMRGLGALQKNELKGVAAAAAESTT